MYPSFTNTYIQPTISSYTTHEPNLSKTPHFITLEQDQSTIFNQQLQHPYILFSDHDHSNHKTNINVHHHKLASDDHEIRATGDDNNSKKISSSKRRRPAGSRNDRHSKINTAQGPRDRRMRLSLDVAKKFFKLQDILGFDKASKTVEWLLMKSESNIQLLLPTSTPHEVSESSTSRCEVFSENKKKSSSSSSNINRKDDKKKLKTISRAGVRKSLYVAKETREMARKRARERTVEKSSSKISGCVDHHDQFLKFRPCLNQETDSSLGSWIINQPDQVLQPASSQYFQFEQGISDGNSSSVIGNWNLSSLLNYQHTGVLHANDQHHQLNDFQILGNLWEAGYN